MGGEILIVKQGSEMGRKFTFVRQVSTSLVRRATASDETRNLILDSKVRVQIMSVIVRRIRKRNGRRI